MFKSLNRGISTAIAFIIIVLCAVFVGGITAWRYIEMPENEEAPEVKPSKDETADWKTYRNEKYGFKIKYPPDWRSEVVDWPDPADRAKLSIYLYPPEVDPSYVDARDPVVLIGVTTTTGGSSLPLALFGKRGESMLCEIVQIGNFNFCKLTIEQSDVSSTGITIYAIDKDSLIYTIAISCGWPECGTRSEFEVFQKILSTFKLLE